MTTPTTPDLTCPVCRAVNPATRQFCRRCAADLRAPAPGATPAEEAPAAASMQPILIGAGIALALVLIGIVGLLVLGGSPSASPTPGATSSVVPASAPPATPSVAPTVAPTQAPTSAPLPTPPGPSSSAPPGSPVVDTLKGPGRASCTGTNGTGTPGYIHLEWTASNTTGVRLSIDPPAPNDAYDYGYDDYPADGAADVPFTCDPPNSDANGEYHLYVVTTLHDDGRFAWRYIRVYLRT
jgi:hypothetical protein